MSIQKEFTIRYKTEGHVRFEVPNQLCDPSVSRLLTAKILEIDGVYRVNLFRKQRKLSIRYQDTVCSFSQLADQLFQLLSELEQKKLLITPAVNDAVSAKKVKWDIKSKMRSWKASKWATEKYADVKETVYAAKVVTKLGLKKPNSFIKDPEKTIIEFLNDVLVLYLIRLHWTRITQEWIPRPWAFKSQWAAVFYLFYLLVRSRRPTK